MLPRLTADSFTQRQSPAPADQQVPPVEPLSALLVRRGPVGLRPLRALLEDPRFELFATDELTSDWISFGRRVCVVFVATFDDPLSAFGYAITAGLRRPIVVLHGSPVDHDRSLVLAAGAAACIRMPATRSEIDAILPMLPTRGGAARIDTTLRLLLDPVARTVRYHDKTVRLSQREFAVLHCLSSRGGEPVSAEDLLTSVWGEAPSAERKRQILDVYIFQLRRKLEPIGLSSAITTLRGYGYALGHAQTT